MRFHFLIYRKTTLFNFITKYSPFFSKFRYYILISFTIIILFSVLPGFIISIFIDKNKIYKQINTMSIENNIKFASDGIVKNWYRDIIIYNVRVSDNSATQNQQQIITIPELRIIPNLFLSIEQKKLNIEKIILKDARWKYLRKDNSLDHELQKKIMKLLMLTSDYNVVLINNTITLTFEKKNYERQIWNIPVDHGFIKSEKNKIQISIYYDDLAWGNGRLNFSPDLCNQCNLLNGKYDINLSKLPLNRISWFFDPLKFNDGFIDLKSTMLYVDTEKNKEIDLKSNVHMRNVLISDIANHPVLENSQIDLDIVYQDKSEFVHSEFNGYWKKSQFKGAFTKKKKSAYPESLIISLDNKRESPIPLLYGYSLEGLKTFNIAVQEDKTGKSFLSMNGLFLTSKNGGIVDPDHILAINLPDVSLTLDNNQFNGIINLAKNQSDLKFHFTGSVIPYNKTIETQIEFDDYTKNKQISYNGVVFEIIENGEINSDNLNWKDFEMYYENIDNWWNNSIKNDQYRGWRPSIFRERDWFQKYLMRSSVNNSLTIKNWRFSEQQSVPVTGSIKLNNSIFDIQLNSEPQFYNLMIDMTNNTPLFRGEYKLLFEKLNNYSIYWFPRGLISRFTESMAESKFTTSGEHPVDLLTNFNSNETIQLKKAVITVDDQKPSDEWEKLNLDIRKYGSKYQINLNGENESSSINGWGSYDKDDNGWKIKTSVLQKR